MVKTAKMDDWGLSIKMKKFINDPYNVTCELLEGMCMAHSDSLVKLNGNNIVLLKTLPPENYVRIVIGGGSGHEPVFVGFVGTGMAHAAAHGDIFTSPSADLVEKAVKDAGGNAGTILIYGNYQGDILNFDLAQELCRLDGMRVETVRVWDDIASAPPERKNERRGTAADLLVIKIAGAASGRGMPFEDVLRVTVRARDACRSIGIALSSCTLPTVGKPIFSIDDEEMMIGMGLHGEPGISRVKMVSADKAADMMLDAILSDDLAVAKEDEVIVLINGYGSTTLMEQYIINRRVRNRLEDLGINVHANLVGNYCTSQEMAGCSLTLMKADEELASLFDEQASSPGFTALRR